MADSDKHMEDSMIRKFAWVGIYPTRRVVVIVLKRSPDRSIMSTKDV